MLTAKPNALVLLHQASKAIGSTIESKDFEILNTKEISCIAFYEDYIELTLSDKKIKLKTLFCETR